MGLSHEYETLNLNQMSLHARTDTLDGRPPLPYLRGSGNDIFLLRKEMCHYQGFPKCTLGTYAGRVLATP